MLKQKKIKKEKLIIYIIIMAVMFGGTGFFIYKNYSLTAVKAPTEFSNIFETDDFKKINISEEEGGGKGEIAEIAEIAAEDKRGDEILDTGIFSDPKFRALKDNSVKQTDNIPVGRVVPFEPY
jgi:hypothetical protein